jgi:DNA invertase Pin-like site-specific DNA recombinase
VAEGEGPKVTRHAESAHAQMLQQMRADGISYRRIARVLGYHLSTIADCARGDHAPRVNLQRDIETLWEQWRQRAAEQSDCDGSVAKIPVEGSTDMARHKTATQAHTFARGGVQPRPGQAGTKMTRHEYILNAVQYAKRGNELPTAKLNPDIVREIRENRNGETHGATAKRYGVHYNTVMRIRHYEAWRHVR